MIAITLAVGAMTNLLGAPLCTIPMSLLWHHWKGHDFVNSHSEPSKGINCHCCNHFVNHQALKKEIMLVTQLLICMRFCIQPSLRCVILRLLCWIWEHQSFNQTYEDQKYLGLGFWFINVYYITQVYIVDGFIIYPLLKLARDLQAPKQLLMVDGEFQWITSSDRSTKWRPPRQIDASWSTKMLGTIVMVDTDGFQNTQGVTERYM